MPKTIEGVLTAIVTPFTATGLRTAETGRVDCALQRNCRRTEHSDVSL
ncbi:hypothetical protein i01_00881 [Escherichia coli cloneA_i1]|nr:hypothetical protein i01_00881 [Escherichia coli cloneA_i1]